MRQSYQSVFVGLIKAAVALIPSAMEQMILCILKEARLADNYAKLQMCGVFQVAAPVFWAPLLFLNQFFAALETVLAPSFR